MPSDDEVEYVQELAEQMIIAPLEKLLNGGASALNDKELLNILTIASKSFEACSSLCPLLDADEEVLSLIPMAVSNVKLGMLIVNSLD